MGAMESQPQGEGIEVPSVVPLLTNARGGNGLVGGARHFECSLGLDEQVKNISSCYRRLFYRLNDAGTAWFKAAIERLRMDPRFNVQTLGMVAPPESFWKGATALHVAIMANDIKMVQNILEIDLVLDIDGRMGVLEYTALHWAAVGGNINIVHALVENGANPMIVGHDKRSILHFAVTDGNEQMVDWILARYPSLVNAQDAQEMAPLHLAVSCKYTHVMIGVLKSLCLCQDIDMKALDQYGWSAFYIAVLQGDAKLVIQLLDYGKDKIRLNEACDEEKGPPIQIAYERGYKDIENALMECESVKGYMAKLYRDRQVYVDSANAILVGAALIASVTFASWLQPPLNYTSYFGEAYSSAVSSSSSLGLNYADLEHNIGLQVFWIFNALSFYFAMATVVSGAATVIPRSGLFIKDAVEKLAMSLQWTSTLLAFSVVFVIIAFAIAGSIVVTPLLKYQWYMVGPTIVGGIVCIFNLGHLFKIVLENIGVYRKLVIKLKAYVQVITLLVETTVDN